MIALSTVKSHWLESQKTASKVISQLGYLIWT